MTTEEPKKLERLLDDAAYFYGCLLTTSSDTTMPPGLAGLVEQMRLDRINFEALSQIIGEIDQIDPELLKLEKIDPSAYTPQERIDFMLAE